MRTNKILAAVVAVAALFLVTSCSSGGSSTSGVQEQMIDSADAAGLVNDGKHLVIDVRTPEEFAVGHLEGAENIDVQAADFADRIKALDPKASYVVYCRSGNRATTAVQTMSDAGFTEVVNGGGLDQLVAAGAPLAQ